MRAEPYQPPTLRDGDPVLAGVVAGWEHAPYSPGLMQEGASELLHRHLFGMEGASREEMKDVLDPADGCIELNRQAEMNGLRCLRTIINRFFESSTRTRTSVEVVRKPAKGEEAASG